MEQPFFFGLDRSVWFFGIVEDRNDPLTLGRCKVRIFGTHPEDKTLVATDDLPWAFPITPITHAAAYGVGPAPVGPIVGTIVFGFFGDGVDRQLPFMMGTVPGSIGQFNYGVQQPLPPAGGDGTSAYGPTAPPGQQLSAPVNGLPKGSKSLNVRAAGFAAVIRQKFPALADIHACAIVGNLCAESTLRAVRNDGVKPINVPPPAGTKGVAYGLGQWTGSRLTGLLDYAKAHGYTPDSDEANIGWLITELNNSYSTMIKNLASQSKTVAGLHYSGADPGPFDCSTIEGSTAYVMNYYERPGDNSCGKRINFAKLALSALNKSAVPVTSAGKPNNG